MVEESEMNKHRKIVVAILGCIVTAGFTALLLNVLLPKAQPQLTTSVKLEKESSQTDLKVVGIGDSLTKGVGDEDGAGGYIPILGDELDRVYNFHSIEMFNYGKSGNVTTQVTKRIKDSKEIQENIAKADLVVVTIGANDLLNVVKGNLLDSLAITTFDEPREEYLVNLSIMWNEIRQYNQDCPIYIMGIYNPFYVHFREVTELQDIVNTWNETTKNFVLSKDKTYFVPVNDLIYQGDGMVSNEDENDLLSTDDSFHPNHSGYQLIAKAFRDVIMETEELWLEK